MADMKSFLAGRKTQVAAEPAPIAEPAPEVVAPQPKLASVFANRVKMIVAGEAPPPVPASEVSDSMDLSDLANLDVTEAPVTRNRGPSQFDDETPATKPVRELPEGIDKTQLQFVELIDGVYEILGDTELLGNVIRSIMIELKSNPQYMKLVAKEDVRAWVRAMRDSMGLARIKKQETKAKRSSGTGGKSKAIDSDMLNAFNDLGVNFDDA